MAARFRRRALLGVLGLFILFLYGPTLTILVLSFQGSDGGLTFPMNPARKRDMTRSICTSACQNRWTAPAS